jgi:hypothetical protein
LLRKLLKKLLQLKPLQKKTKKKHSLFLFLKNSEGVI